MRTSLSHPLYIATLQVPGAEGRIGMTFCPGKRGDSVFGDAWHRDLGIDLDVIKNWGAAVVVTLMEEHEFEMLKVDDLPGQVRQRGMEWLHLPIPDLSAPCIEFERMWEEDGGRIRTLLSLGENVLLHCRGGLGRTGTVAALLLVEFGAASADAITLVRQTRPGTIETQVQEN
jgi:ADP-ribosyl-[dinitrogen reductase] hydrolase